MKIKNLFSEKEPSSEPVRTSNYVRYLGLEHYEPGVQYDPHEYLLQLQKFTPILMMTACLR